MRETIKSYPDLEVADLDYPGELARLFLGDKTYFENEEKANKITAEMIGFQEVGKENDRRPFENPGEDFRPYLEKYKKGNVKSSQDLRVRKRWGQDDMWTPKDSVDKQMYFDTYLGFILTAGKRYSACIGFSPLVHNNYRPEGEGGILINQIQGVKGELYIPQRFDWASALVEFVEEWAKEFEIPRVGILPFLRNQWKDKKDEHKRMRRNYDGTAEKRGYKYDKKREIYVKEFSKEGLEEKVEEGVTAA